jgi:hypothetical protein
VPSKFLETHKKPKTTQAVTGQNWSAFWQTRIKPHQNWAGHTIQGFNPGNQKILIKYRYKKQDRIKFRKKGFCAPYCACMPANQSSRSVCLTVFVGG